MTARTSICICVRGLVLLSVISHLELSWGSWVDILHCKNKIHLGLHDLLWDTCVLKETHTHVYGQTYMFLNERMRFCKYTLRVLRLHDMF